MFTTRDNKLVETQQTEIEYTREDLLRDKATCEAEIAAVTARLERVNALLAECDNLGIGDEL